jgi:hypothetical protein
MEFFKWAGEARAVEAASGQDHYRQADSLDVQEWQQPALVSVDVRPLVGENPRYYVLSLSQLIQKKNWAKEETRVTKAGPSPEGMC